MADLKKIDEAELDLQKMQDKEFNRFPLDEFKNAGQISNDNDPGLLQARAAELYNIEQDIIQPYIKYESSTKVSPRAQL